LENRIVDSLVIAGIVLACTFGAAIAGMFLCARLPEQHLSDGTKDVMKMGMGLIATMSALVLGLLVASAKSSFDAQRTGYQQMAINFVLLDRALARYGPEAKNARALLHKTVTEMIDLQWSADDARRDARLDDPALTVNAAALFAAIQGLTPRDEGQKATKAWAFQLTIELARARWMLSQKDEGSIPIPFLVVLVFWLGVLFLSFGLFAPRNATTIAILFVSALSVASALFLIVDLDHPTRGVFQTSAAPLRHALSQLGQE